MFINNIIDGQLWEKVISRKEEFRKDKIKNWNAQTFDSHPYANVYFAEKDWISNLVNQSELEIIDPYRVLAICAQTGCGKTSMVFNSCLPIAKKQGKKVLFLSSRSALCKKVKNDAISYELNGEEIVGQIKVKHFKDFFNEKYLDSNIDYGLIHVLTFQRFIKGEYLNLNPQDYAFVVIDEYPSLFVDSLYSPLSEETLKKIICTFRKCRRIYLSGTPQEALEYVYHYEYFYGNHSLNPSFRNNPFHKFFYVYAMDFDYSYLKPHFFTKHSTLIELIRKRSTENWIIFVHNKSVGEYLKNQLADYNLSVEFFTADSEKDCEMYQALLSKEKLTNNLIITTRVLDVGINIKHGPTADNKIFNMVIYEDDPCEIIQMIGRKRVSDDETVNVYFFAPNLEELKSRQRTVTNRINTAKKQIAAVEAKEYLETISPPLYFNGKELKINPFYLSKLKIDSNRYEQLITSMEKCNSCDEQNQVYSNFILGYFDGATYDEDSLFILNLDKELEKILNQYLNKKIHTDKFQEISLQLKELLGENRVKPSDNAPGINKVKELLLPYGYTIISSGDPKMYTFKREENLNVQ